MAKSDEMTPTERDEAKPAATTAERGSTDDARNDGSKSSAEMQEAGMGEDESGADEQSDNNDD